MSFQSRPVLQAVADFSFGMLLFVGLLALIGHDASVLADTAPKAFLIDRFAMGDSGQMMPMSFGWFDPNAAKSTVGRGPSAMSPASVALFGVMFAALVAVNLALFRHMRQVYVPIRRR